MKQIELSPPKQQPVAQVVQVPHECKFNPQSLSDIQNKLASLTNTVNSLKEEYKQAAQQNPKPVQDNIKPEIGKNPGGIAIIGGGGGYQQPKKEPFGGQPIGGGGQPVGGGGQPIGGGGARPGQNILVPQQPIEKQNLPKEPIDIGGRQPIPS